MKIIKLHKEKLFRLENNPRQIIDKKAVDKLRALIKGHGFRGVLDVFKHKSGKYEILCGNHRFDAGVEEGMEEFDCQIYEGSRKKALARAISDNKSSEWTDWYIPGLKDFITEIDDGSVDMYLTGFETKEIEDLFGNSLKEGQTDPDDAPETPVNAKTKRGDLYQLGDHRLLCGDSTSGKDVQRLMNKHKAQMVFTDPPYGLSYKGTNNPNGREWNIIKGDKLRNDDLYKLLNGAFIQAHHVTINNPAIYVWHAATNHIIFESALNDAGFEVKEQIIWNKGMVLGHSDYHWAHEPCFYVRKKGNNNEWFGDRKHKTILRNEKIDFTKMKKEELIQIIHAIRDDSTVWEVKRDNVKTYVHPTQKPVDLALKAIINNTRNDGIVLDLFGGSGSTLIGCEQLNRVCYAMELDEKYADVIVQRWENFTGRKAELIK